MEDRDTVIKELKQALKIKSDESEQQRLRVEIVERYFCCHHLSRIRLSCVK